MQPGQTIELRNYYGFFRFRRSKRNPKKVKIGIPTVMNRNSNYGTWYPELLHINIIQMFDVLFYITPLIIYRYYREGKKEKLRAATKVGTIS